jgi:hypothetical protein
MRVDMNSYPYGHDLHAQSLNWLYANGLDAFALQPAEVIIIGDHLSFQLTSSTWRTVRMREAPERYGLVRSF